MQVSQGLDVPLHEAFTVGHILWQYFLQHGRHRVQEAVIALKASGCHLEGENQQELGHHCHGNCLPAVATHRSRGNILLEVRSCWQDNCLHAAEKRRQGESMNRQCGGGVSVMPQVEQEVM